MSKTNHRVAAVAAGAAILVGFGSFGAVASKMISGNDIMNGSIHKADIGRNAVGSGELMPGAVRLSDLSDGAERGLQGDQGPQGDTGAEGPAGKDGKDGAAGPAGAPGAPGAPGRDGKDAQALPYGVAKVKVLRGSNAATPWATYSTTLGGPEGDTTGGTFRFTCNVAQAPCQVSVAAYSTADGVRVYPRVDIMTESLNGGPQNFCEYGDGPMSGVLTKTAADQLLDIGGSDDCGLNGDAGPVDAITVPAGYYDVTSTFQFVRGVFN